jgi:hypothetical protein
MVRTTKTKEYLKEAKAKGEEEPELTPKGQKPRTLTPEHLEKLKLAREKAREAQIKNTAERKKKKEKVEEVEPPVKIDLSTNEKILQKPVIEEPIFDLESDEEPEVVIKKEKKKKPKKKPVVIVEQESDSESDGDSNVVYIKRRSNKKKLNYHLLHLLNQLENHHSSNIQEIHFIQCHLE